MKQFLLFALPFALLWIAVFVGCRSSETGVQFYNEVPRLVDFWARDENGATLYENYLGERMFTFSYATNASGYKIASVYCGHPSSQALVHRRVYRENGFITRTESITSNDPMVLTVEIFDPKTRKLIRNDWISQGESRQYFQRYWHEKVMSETKPTFDEQKSTHLVPW